MTDRELLELAAKAAGTDHVWIHRGEHLLCWSGKPNESLDKLWDPLTDDGDALRLAVQLNLRVLYHPALEQALVRPYNAAERVRESVENVETHADDPYAATRRAIVRAAAEIGKTL